MDTHIFAPYYSQSINENTNIRTSREKMSENTFGPNKMQPLCDIFAERFAHPGFQCLCRDGLIQLEPQRSFENEMFRIKLLQLCKNVVVCMNNIFGFPRFSCTVQKHSKFSIGGL